MNEKTKFKKNQKVKDLIIIYICYILSYTLSYFLYTKFDNSYLGLLAFDVLATIIIYTFGVIFKNSSVYDPYWSLTPLVMLLILMIDNKLFSLNNIIFLVVFSIWSNRLTINWMITFKSLKVQDWRYQMYKDNNPKIWQLINFFGINFFPTVLVYIGFIPVIMLVQINEINYFSSFGYLILIIGIIFEFLSDHQMHKFLKSDNINKRRVCNIGLWKYSRHPNYLGEILIWYGVYFIMLSIKLQAYYLIIGAILITCLFLFISIPLMEKRQVKRRTEYNEYQKNVSKLLLLPNRKRL